MVAYLGLPQEKRNAVAGLVNFVRNMGSSVGTSPGTTVLARRTQFHQAMLSSNTGLTNPAFRNSAASFAVQLSREGVGQPQLQAYRRIYNTMQNQASTLAYIDTFWLLGIAAGIMFFLSFLSKKNNPGRAGSKPLAH